LAATQPAGWLPVVLKLGASLLLVPHPQRHTVAAKIAAILGIILDAVIG
jgi:hypothetical protein